MAEWKLQNFSKHPILRVRRKMPQQTASFCDFLIKTLYIRDYALIEELEINFGKGLNILTGETGAGKSIIIGALNLILGERADTDAIRTGADKAVAEAYIDAARR
jgi:recombinational DNA repair ATPase RecF